MKKAFLFLMLAILAGNASAQDKINEISTKPPVELAVDAEFPGGNEAWVAYMNKSLKKYEKKIKKEGLSGSVVILFIVDEEGNATKARVLPCKDAGVPNCLPASSELALAGLEIISNSPKWTPANLNGKNVKAYRRQPLSIQLK